MANCHRRSRDRVEECPECSKGYSMSKFLLLLGPSGVGKSSIIERLRQADERFVYISPFMTRLLRDGEKDKVSISDEEMDRRLDRGEFLVINERYGIRYATPKQPIMQALNKGKFPVLDWPISRMLVMTENFPDQLYRVYIAPPSIEVLEQRLSIDGRDTDGSRLKDAQLELEAYWSLQYADMYELEVVTEDHELVKVTNAIYKSYTASFGE